METFDMQAATAVARTAAKDALSLARTFLGRFGLDIALDGDYKFEDDRSDWLGAYVDDSVFSGEIEVAVNYTLLVRKILEVPSGDLRELVRREAATTVWHEAVHGLWQYADDLLRSDPDLWKRFLDVQGRGKTRDMFAAMDRWHEDEETCVENAARILCRNRGNLDAAVLNGNGGRPSPECEVLARFAKALGA